MQITKVKNRSVVFTQQLPDWDLHLHLIMGSKYNYLVDTGFGTSSIAPIKDYLKNSTLPLIVINTHHHWVDRTPKNGD